MTWVVLKTFKLLRACLIQKKACLEIPCSVHISYSAWKKKSCYVLVRCGGMQVFAHFEACQDVRSHWEFGQVFLENDVETLYICIPKPPRSGIKTAEGGHHMCSTSQHPLIFLFPTYFFPWFHSFQVLPIPIVITIIIIGLQCISAEILLESNFPPVLTYLKVSEVGRHLPG